MRIRAGFLKEFTSTWSLLDWNRIDETAPAWVQVSMSQVRPWRQTSADAALRNYADQRVLSAPDPLKPAPTVHFVAGSTDPAPARDDRRRSPLLNLERNRDRSTIDWTDFDRAARHSLLVTGPGELKRQAKMGRTEQQAKDRALVVVSGSISRQVLNGGRAATLTSVATDQQAIGWARLTDSDPCAFCLVLASRGPVYKSESSAGFQAHDACACIPVAVFSKSEPWPGRAREYRRLYDQVAKGQKDPINALRRHLAAQKRDRAPQPLTA